MKYNYLLLALATVALFSCSRNEVEDPDAGGVHVTIHAYQEGAIDTRTTLVDGGTQVYWEPSDEIKVFFRGSGSRFLSQNTANAQVTDFSGSLNVVVGINEGASGSNTLWGLYPYRADATSDGTSVTTTLPAEQTGRTGSFAKNTNITLAQSNSFDLAFYNVTGGIRFSLTQEGVKEVIFEGQNNENIAGKVKLAFADGIPAIQEVVEGQKTITLSAPNGQTFETGKWYYIVALPGTLSNGFKMTFNTATQYATLKSSGSKTIKRGIFGSLADADEDLIYKDVGGDEPPVTGNIEFADPAAKYACVAKFDTNGDGEVSIEEAEAATSFDGLFDDWTGVTSFEEIRFFTSVTSTQNVFTGLTKLKQITIPDNITTLGTFQNCSSLETVSLPEDLVSLPMYCFDGCSSLKSVTLPTGIKSIPSYAFQNCTELKTLSVPSTLISVGQYAFSGCTVLVGMDLPSGLETIGSYAFQSCQSMVTVSMGGCVSVGSYAFYDCSSLESIALPVDLKTIPEGCFQGCTKLVSISWPNALVSIGKNAFLGCKALSSVTIGSGVSIGSFAFSSCQALSSAYLSGGVTIGSFAFNGCSSLTSVVLPEDLTALPEGCFQNCTKLVSISWPNALASIGDKAFSLCRFADNDYTLQLPSSITNIGSNAFEGLRHLILPSTAPISIASDSFSFGYTFLYVPTQMVEMYKARSTWCNHADRIRPISDYPVVPTFIVGGTVANAIDLGLSVKWASWNVGASAPEEYGEYFAWGETDCKWDYDVTSYKWWNGNWYAITRYNNDKSHGTVDNRTTLLMEDDAARVNWGGSWRMPTRSEFQELYSNCTSVWTTENGVYGYRFTSKKAGYTDKSIFLPAAGDRDEYQIKGPGVGGLYWTSSLYTTHPFCANYYYFSSSYLSWDHCGRAYGLSIRPVCN